MIHRMHPSSRAASSAVRVYESVAYLAPIALWASLLAIRLSQLAADREPVIALSTIQLALMTVMLAFRGQPKAVDRSIRSLGSALLGNFLPFALILRDPNHTFATASEVIVITSLGISIWAALSLRTSVSIAPANRGVKTSGPYRFVRHPMYAAVILGQFGLLLTYPSLVNVLILATAVAFKIRMVLNEERVLQDDPAYREYRATVCSRFIPGVV